MRADVLKELLASVADCSADTQAKAEFRKLIEAVGLANGVCLSSRAERVAFARSLLEVGIKRAEIKGRLMARFEVGDSQAYRDIADALKTVPI